MKVSRNVTNWSCHYFSLRTWIFIFRLQSGKNSWCIALVLGPLFPRKLGKPHCPQQSIGLRVTWGKEGKWRENKRWLFLYWLRELHHPWFIFTLCPLSLCFLTLNGNSWIYHVLSNESNWNKFTKNNTRVSRILLMDRLGCISKMIPQILTPISFAWTYSCWKTKTSPWILYDGKLQPSFLGGY